MQIGDLAPGCPSAPWVPPLHFSYLASQFCFKKEIKSCSTGSPEQGTLQGETLSQRAKRAGGAQGGQKPSQHHGTAHGQHLGKTAGRQSLFPKESQGQGSGLQQQQGPFSPRDSCREQVPAWLPSNPPKDKEFGGLTQCSELPSLLAGTL